MAKTFNLNLYEITEELLRIEDALYESGGELTPDAERELVSYYEMDDEKSAGYYALIKRFEETAKGFKAEADRLTGLAYTAKNAAGRLKKRMQEAMEARGIERKEHRLGRFRLQNNPEAVTFLESAPPTPPADSPYARVKVEWNLAALKDDLQSQDFETRNRAEQIATLTRSKHLRMD